AAGSETAEISLGNEGWARTYLNDKQQRIQLSRATDVWTPGDVIFVAEREGRWTLRQIPAVQGAFMAMDPHNGRVLALQGGFSFQDSVFNRATQALRQPGSSFKPFVYAAALDAGYSPATVVMDAPIVVRAGGQTWKPKNSSGKFYGPTPLRRGLELSRNLMTVRIAQQIGMERIAEYAERFGVYEDMPHHLSFALGAGETTLYQMVGAYGMFANGGKRVEPTLVDRIQDRHGATLFRHDPRDCDGCELASLGGGNGGGGGPVLYDTRSQIMSPITATQLVSMLEGVVTQGTATRTVGGLGFPVAGKTGTTNDSRDAWFVGFSPNLVAGCFIGFDQPRPMGRGAYGGTLCGPVFKDFMAAAMEDREAGSFKGASNLGLVMVKIDSNTGERLPDDAEGAHVLTEFFTAGTEPPLYASFALDGDEALFGAAAVSDLPFADFDEPEAGYSEAPLQPAEGTAERALPQPPSGGDAEDIGLGTGGFY
ncbi:MAG: penicillin-binding transpeptidase domain-containing protein, partial [Pseudomonadota bacterium]